MIAVVAFIVWTVVALAVGLVIGAMLRRADIAQTEQQPEAETDAEPYVPRSWVP